MPTGPSQPDPRAQAISGRERADSRQHLTPEHTRTLMDPAPGGLTDPHSTGHGTGHGTRAGRTGGLRLVRTELSPDVDARYSRPVRAKLAGEVGAENRRAAGLSDRDVRRIMAQRVAEHIEGGRAGILAPEKRRALVSTAQRMGIRPFDANLIIAVVQDRFRRGLLGQASAGTDDRLELIAAPAGDAGRLVHPALVLRRRERFWQVVRLLLASAAIAGILTVWLVNWLTGRLP